VSEPDDQAAATVEEEETSRIRGLARRWTEVRASGEAVMSTAEYAVGTVAACAFAAVLYKVVTGGSIVTALGHLIDSALSTLS
jgi:hypothetical protein